MQLRRRITGAILKLVGNVRPERIPRSFDERVKLQKTVYLLQEFGFDLGYDFSWYVHGPYSVLLTRDGYALARSDFRPKSVRLTEDYEDKFRQFVSDFLGQKKNNTKWLELLASMLFLRKRHPSWRKEMIFNRLRRKRLGVTRQAYEEAWRHLEKFGLPDDQ